MAAQTPFMFAPVPQHPAELWKMSTDRIVSLLQTLVAMYGKGTKRGVRLLGPHQAPPGPLNPHTSSAWKLLVGSSGLLSRLHEMLTASKSTSGSSLILRWGRVWTWKCQSSKPVIGFPGNKRPSLGYPVSQLISIQITSSFHIPGVLQVVCLGSGRKLKHIFKKLYRTGT